MFTNVKEETSDGLSATTEHTPTTRQQEETNIEPQTTDGAGRTKLPTKTDTFWAWVSAHQARSFRFLKGALYRIWCGVNRLGDSGVKVV